MKSVVLVHQREILHYRITIYNQLAAYLSRRGWDLTVLAQSLQPDTPQQPVFRYQLVEAATIAICTAIRAKRPDAVISFVNAKERYLFPMLFYLKASGIPAIYWGHGIDLEDRKSHLKRAVYAFEHALCGAVLLYSENQLADLTPHARAKAFVARNTIDCSLLSSSGLKPASILESHRINTHRNVICVGRMQRRKRIHHLIEAFERLERDDCGLILVGPDDEGSLSGVVHPRIYRMGPLYGTHLHDLLRASDVYCLPGHVGLSIVDAMYFGLPFVTEDVDHAPEIMYLKDGVNGFIVPADDVDALVNRLTLLLTDDALRQRMSSAAKETILKEASLEKMFSGFLAALDHVAKNGPDTSHISRR